MNKNTIVLISGCQGSGKTTTSTRLIEELNSRGVTTYSIKFAEIIYKMHDAVIAVGIEYGIPMLKKESTMLQWLGTEFGRNTKGEDVWINAVRHKILSKITSDFIPARCCFVIDDCRFVNEFHGFDQIEEMGLVSVLRVRLEASEEERKARADSWRTNTAHVSETGLDEYSAAGLFDKYYNTGAGGSFTVDIVDDILDTILVDKIKAISP